MTRPHDQFTTVEGFQTRNWQMGQDGPSVVFLRGIDCPVLEWEHSIHALITQ